MILAATGHRPDKLGGYGSIAYNKLVNLAEIYLKNNKPKGIISGMALGWDQAWCEAGQRLKIPVTAAIPCDNMHHAWPDKSQEKFLWLLTECTDIKNVSPGPYAKWKMQKRNEWMVDNCDKIIALWNGSPGGTANCLKYALDQGKEATNLWKDWQNA
mgnify:CR=1 FL=1